MPFTTSDALLTQLRTQIAACAAWTAGSSAVHYPEVDWASAVFPCAVLAEEQRTSSYYAAGASGLRGGTLKVAVYTQDTIGNTEQLGRDVLEQLLAQQSGIVFRSGYVGLCGEASDAMTAAQTSVNACEIFLDYGLEA